MSRRLARRLAALAREGRPRVAVARIDGFHVDQARVTVRDADDQTSKGDTDGNA